MKSKVSCIVKVDKTNVDIIKRLFNKTGWKIDYKLLDNIKEPRTILCNSMTKRVVRYCGDIDDPDLIDCRDDKDPFDVLGYVTSGKRIIETSIGDGISEIVGKEPDNLEDILKSSGKLMRYYNNCAFLKGVSYDIIALLTEKLHYNFSGIGYKELGCIATTNLLGPSPEFSTFSLISEEMFYDTNPHCTWNCAGRIDCGTNVELFKAIVALSDYNDSCYQWYISKDGSTWVYHPNYKNYGTELRKATVEELIEHFKDGKARD